MIETLKALLNKNDSFYLEYEDQIFENLVTRKQLIASLTKPIITYYFQNKIFINGYSKETPLVDIIHTNHNVNLGEILDHSAGLWDYLEYMEEDEVNRISLREIVERIIKESVNKYSAGQKTYPFEYSNSSYVLLSYLIEVIDKNSYEETLSRYFQKFEIDFSFKSIHSRWLTGWGDGAAVCSVKDYLKFTQLERSSASFGKVTGPFGELACYLGFVPGFETFVAFSNNFKLIYFIEGTDEPNHTNKLYKALGGII